jgi:Ni/Co efflux regulator RcnB
MGRIPLGAGWKNKGGLPMTTNKLAVSLLFAAAMTCSPVVGLSQSRDDNGAKQDMRDAGHETKNAAKDVGHGVKSGTEKGYHKTKRGTKKAWNKTKDTTKGAAHGAKEGAHDSDDYNRPH